MADNEQDERQGNGRATVALVDAKLDGIRGILDVELRTIREKLDPLVLAIGDIPEIKTRVAALEKRCDEYDADDERRSDWRTVKLPTLIFASLGSIGGIIGALSVFHV